MATLDQVRPAPRAVGRPVRRGAAIGQLTLRVVIYLLLALGAALVLVHFFWMLSTSLKSQDRLFVYPPEWIPRPPHVSNYLDAWNALPFGRFLFNTIFMTALAMFAELATASLVAYGFARFRFPLRNTLFVVLLSTMMLPSILTLIPKFVMWKSVNRIDTFTPMTAGAWFAWGPAYIFLLRQFFLTIPRELEDAARIDGASALGVYWRIIMPLSGPALATLGVFTFTAQWNSFLWPLIVITDAQMRTLTVGLRALVGQYTVQSQLLMAGSVIALLPMLIVFLLAQRFFVRGIALTGLAGR